MRGEGHHATGTQWIAHWPAACKRRQLPQNARLAHGRPLCLGLLQRLVGMVALGARDAQQLLQALYLQIQGSRATGQNVLVCIQASKGRAEA